MANPNRTVKIQAPTKPVLVSLCIANCQGKIIHTFNGLLGADLDQLCATESYTADVREDIVSDNQADR